MLNWKSPAFLSGTRMSTFTLYVAILLFCWAAVSDFRSWKIPNWIVGLLCLLYIVNVGIVEVFGLQPKIWDLSTLPGDFAAFGLLLAIGFLFWRLRMFGAGDAKLLAAIGIFVGWSGLLAFSILLLFSAVIVWVLVRLPMPQALHMSKIIVRLDEIRRTRKIPYGVVMVPAALVVVLQRFQVSL
jgi:prepilin peptidase CpaA